MSTQQCVLALTASLLEPAFNASKSPKRGSGTMNLRRAQPSRDPIAVGNSSPGAGSRCRDPYRTAMRAGRSQPPISGMDNARQI